MKMSAEQLGHILQRHALWRRGENDGIKADLRGADLRDADLREADLREADLRKADLRKADLSGVHLWEADLRYADLREADLWGADLREAHLRGAHLWGADLREADLREADLRGAHLWGADLREAHLWGADLREAHLSEAKNIDDFYLAQLSIVPETGAFDGWKKLRDGMVAHISIPDDAKRSSATGRKCRASHANVVAIYAEGGQQVASGVSLYDETFVYTVGETVQCKSWEEDRFIECGGGIHFYLTRIEAAYRNG